MIFSDKKLNKKLLKKSDQDRAQAILNHFAVTKESETADFFESVFAKADTKFIRKDNRLIIAEQNAAVFFKFSFEPLSVENILSIYREFGGGKIIILTAAKSENAEKYLPAFENLEIVTGEQVYLLLKKYDIYPALNEKEIKAENKFKSILKAVFARDKAKKFAFFGFSMLLFSLIIPFPLYYIIMGSLLLIISIICRIFGYKKEKLTFMI